MNETNLILAQNENFNFVRVRFLDGNNPKGYFYKTFQFFEVGDRAVVDSPISGLTVVEIVEIDCLLGAIHQSEGYYKWIVQKVDLTDFERCRELEKAVTSKVLKIRYNKLRQEAAETFKDALGEESYEALVHLVNGDVLESDEDSNNLPHELKND